MVTMNVFLSMPTMFQNSMLSSKTKTFKTHTMKLANGTLFQDARYSGKSDNLYHLCWPSGSLFNRKLGASSLHPLGFGWALPALHPVLLGRGEVSCLAGTAGQSEGV